MKTWLLVIVLCALMLYGCVIVDRWSEDKIRKLTENRVERLENINQ